MTNIVVAGVPSNTMTESQSRRNHDPWEPARQESTNTPGKMPS